MMVYIYIYNLKTMRIKDFFTNVGNELSYLFEHMTDYKEVLPFLYILNKDESDRIKEDVLDFLRQQLTRGEFNEDSEMYQKLLNPKNLIRIIQGVNSSSTNYKEFKQYI